jgi:hypothetical protein
VGATGRVQPGPPRPTKTAHQQFTPKQFESMLSVKRADLLVDKARALVRVRRSDDGNPFRSGEVARRRSISIAARASGDKSCGCGSIKPVDQIDHVPGHALIAALIGELLPNVCELGQDRLGPRIARLVGQGGAFSGRLPKLCRLIFLHFQSPRTPLTSAQENRLLGCVRNGREVVNNSFQRGCGRCATGGAHALGSADVSGRWFTRRAGGRRKAPLTLHEEEVLAA